jgi:ribosomal protein L37E
MTFDDLLNHIPGLRRLRQLNADMLRILFDRKAGECSWCGQPVGKGRSTWCSDACVEAFKLRCHPMTWRDFVEKRDGGICRRCGRDTVAAESEAKTKRLVAWPNRLRDETMEEWVIRKEVAIAQLRLMGHSRGRWREVDHDPPVSEYGGLCDPAQLRLLCGTCHDEATAQLAGRRAKKKKTSI